MVEATVFCGMCHGIETLHGIHCKLHLMGFLMDRLSSYAYGDNMSVVANASKSESTLKKKAISVCYHEVHEAIEMGEALVGQIPTKKKD